ncbi:phage tail length tape measure family protein [Devosia sp. J2-20]|uniref:phage tail length tape measure family protein n=1 Tax=Devosia sp. J2-20 TaxID=3026161 RepID=UPI00249A2DA3|nr:phage tail length tape measure family protein [Devosia sp. J2-20]WDR00754.1 phage tail length tape measure family protein [Devosia sp. J2-20]
MAKPFVISAKFTLDSSSGIASANQIRQEFGKIEASAGSAATSIARMAEQQQRAGTLRASGVNSALGVQDNFNSAARSADIAAYGRELDQLRARFNPVFAAQQQFVALSGEIHRAQQLGAISASEAAAAIRREEMALLATTAALRQNSQAANENKAALAHHSAGRNNFNTANAAAQFQDIGVTAGMGMDPRMIGLQQGTQLAAVFGTMKLTDAVKTLGAAFASVLSPVSLLTIAAVTLGATGIQAMMGWISASGKAANGIDGVTQALAEQAAPIDSIKARISELQGITDAYAKAIRGTAKDQSIASAAIIANSEREFNAKKSLLELELKRQKAAIAVGEAELTIAGRNLAKDVQSKTQNGVLDPIAGGYADDRVGQFVRSPQQANLLKTTQDLIDANPINDQLKEMRANLELSKIATEGLDDALGTTFSEGVATSIERISSTAKGAKTGAEKAAEKYRDLIRTAQQRIGMAEVEASALGMTRESVARLTIAQELQNKAVNDNIRLTPKQITELDHYAASIATAEERTRSLSETYEFGKGVFGSFFSDLKSGARDGADALTVLGNAGANAFDRIADHALALAANSAFDLIFNAIMGGISGGFGGNPLSLGAGGTGFLGGGASAWGSFDTGGWTGGTNGQVRGIVHAEEFVVRAGPAAQNRQLLETINKGGTLNMGGGQYSLPATYNFYGSGFTEEQALRLMADNERRRMEELPAALADVQRRARAA